MVYNRRTGNAMWEREKARRGIVPAGATSMEGAKIEEYLEGPPLFQVRKLRVIENGKEVSGN